MANNSCGHIQIALNSIHRAKERDWDKLHRIPLKVPAALETKCAKLFECTMYTVNDQDSRCPGSPCIHLWPASFILIFEFRVLKLKRQTSKNDLLSRNIDDLSKPNIKPFIHAIFVGAG